MHAMLRLVAASLTAGLALWCANFAELYFIRFATGVKAIPAREQFDFLFLIYVILVTPIVEETIFRYGLIRLAMKRLPPKISIPVSAAAFLAWHVNYFSPDLSRILASLTFVTAGIGLGYLYVKSGTILAPMLAHGGYNALTALLSNSLYPLETIPAPAIPVLAVAIFFAACWCFLATCESLSFANMIDRRGQNRIGEVTY